MHIGPWRCEPHVEDCRALLTLVCELEALPVLRVVTVEVDERLVCGAQQRCWQVTPTELPDHRAGVVRTILNLKVVMVCFRGEIQKLDVCSCKNKCTISHVSCQSVQS